MKVNLFPVGRETMFFYKNLYIDFFYVCHVHHASSLFVHYSELFIYASKYSLYSCAAVFFTNAFSYFFIV